MVDSRWSWSDSGLVDRSSIIGSIMENVHLNQSNILQNDLALLSRVAEWLRLRDIQESAVGFRFSGSNAAREIELMVKESESSFKAQVEQRGT